MTIFLALLNWYIVSVTAFGILGLFSGFWHSQTAKWLQVIIFLATSIFSAMTSTSGGNFASGIFLVFGLMLSSEYRLGKVAIWIAVVFTVIVYPLAVIEGYYNVSTSYVAQAVLTIICGIIFILLYGGIMLRHEYRHRQDTALLESRVEERTAEINAALKERSVMLQEIHHRVKNNLQVIISILRLEKDRLDEPHARAAIETSVQRIFAMALVHETLYDSGQLDKIDIVKYTNALIEIASDSSTNEFSLEAEGPLLAGLDFAVPFGLLVNELISNSEKHAFPSGVSGKVSIKVSSSGGLTLVVADNGVGISESVQVEGPVTLGLNLVKALAQQLHGRVELDRKTGTRWTIRFPASALSMA